MKLFSKQTLSIVLFFTSTAVFAQEERDCGPRKNVALAAYMAEADASEWLDMGVSFVDQADTRASAFDIKVGPNGVENFRFRSTKGPNERTLFSIQEMAANKPVVLLKQDGHDVITLVPAVVDNKCLGPKGCQAYLKYLHRAVPVDMKTRVVSIKKADGKWVLSITGEDTKDGVAGAYIRNVKKVKIIPQADKQGVQTLAVSGG